MDNLIKTVVMSAVATYLGSFVYGKYISKKTGA